MSALSKIDRKYIVISSVCLAVGFGIGVFVEQWLLWYRQVGRFNEMLRRLSIIEDELLQLKLRIKLTKKPIPAPPDETFADATNTSETNNFVSCRRSSSDDEFADAESDADEYMSISSMQSLNTDSRSDIMRDNFLAKIDLLLGGTYDQIKHADQLLRDKRIEYSEDPDFLWRKAKSSHLMFLTLGGSMNDTAKQHLYEGLGFIEKGLRIDTLNPSVHKWYGVLKGSIGECEGINQKIENGFVFKQHIDRALELDENDAETHYLNGRFCYGVYMLTWVERKLASTLFATPPTATIDEALQAFLRSERLEQNRRIRNQLYIANCYIQLYDEPKAVFWLESAMCIDTNDDVDKSYLPEVIRLLEKHRR